MENKADIKLKMSKKDIEIKKYEQAVKSVDAQLSEIPRKIQEEVYNARRKAEQTFKQKQQRDRDLIAKAIADKRQAAEDLVDTFPDLDTKEFAGRFEIKALEEHLAEVYPKEMIEDYICMDPIPIEEDEDAFKIYNGIENGVMSLTRGGKFSSSLFNRLTTSLTAITESSSVGLKAIPILIFIYFIGIYLSPFLFFTAFSVIGLVSAVQGATVKRLLRRMYSVKLFLNTSYDEDIFRKDKADIMQSIDSYLSDAQEQYMDFVNARMFQFDTETENQIKKTYDSQKVKLEQTRDLNNSALQKAKGELEMLLKQYDEMEEAEKKRADVAKKKYLGTLDWQRTWLDRIFVDVSKENRIIMLPFSKGNTLYYSVDPEPIKQLLRLIVFQIMLRMHPNFACQVVLDFKYMGGDLTQFLNIPNNCLKICFSDDDLKKEQDLITNEIKARTSNILSGCEDLDEFNEKMSEYGSPGECYYIVHIVGLDSIPAPMLQWFRNGPRVGYLFKFYWTVEEIQKLSENLPLSYITEFFEVKDNPVGRTASAVKRLVNPDS